MRTNDGTSWLRWLGLLALGGTMIAARQRRTMTLRDRVVAITGGSRGLGLAIARELVERGARVALIARTESDLEAAADAIEGWGGARPLTLACDVADREAVRDAIDRIVAEHGHIDVLVNDAGMITVGPCEHMRTHDFERAMATHFWGPLYAMQAVIPIMRRRGHGRIVNISSIGGRIAVPHLLPYSASKFALVGLSDGMRAELVRHGIRVTTVCPGLMRTGSHLNVSLKGHHERELAWFSILLGIPGVSMSVRRAARRIVRALALGEPALTLGLPAKLAVLVQTLAPETTAALMTLVARLLPGPRQDASPETRSGWESRSRWVPSRLTRLADRAVEPHNELRGHSPAELEPGAADGR
jgi:NAD(P)-dependent dehydrogenase (short-subunit alcohol dehydrogenase family)